jgi:hypothetical protein
VRTDPSAAPGAETEGRVVALNGTARPSLRDRHLCDKPSRPEAATQAAWSRTVFPYALPSRFQFTLNQDMEIFDGVRDARSLTAAWRAEYNAQRSHSSLGYLTPAGFAAACAASASAKASAPAAHAACGKAPCS